MLKEIFKNVFTKKKAIPFPEGFNVTPDQAAKIIDFQRKIDTIFHRSLRIRFVDAGSCNACEWEGIALMNPIYDIQRFGIDFVASPRHADLLLVTGPVARQMELALRRTYSADAGPEARCCLRGLCNERRYLPGKLCSDRWRGERDSGGWSYPRLPADADCHPARAFQDH